MNLVRKIKNIFNTLGNNGINKKDQFDNKINNTHIDSNAILSLTSACIDLENNLGITSTGKCGICVKDVNTALFEDMRKYVRDFLQIVSDQQNTKNLSFSYNV
ncbi:MAG: PspA-associated protein PspAB, partial [Nitrososphaeraceae archaeon]